MFKRFGFAAVVTLLIVAMAVAVVGKTVLGRGGAPQAGAAAMPGSGPPAGAGKSRGGGDAPSVVAGVVSSQPFYDVARAIGTAQARESIIVSAKVTDVIRTIRFDSGDRVRRGQVLVQLSSVEQSAALEEARAGRDAARRDYDRFRDLGDKGFAPAQRVEAARAAFEAADARVRAGESRIGDRTIRAPFDGVMGLRTASPGALVRPGDPIGTLDDVSEIKLDFDLAESQIDQAKLGAAIVARSAAQPEREFTGVVANVDTRVNVQSRTLRVRAILANRDGALKPGMLMTVELRSNPRVALAAPEIAVLERSDGSYLYTLAARDGRDVVAPKLVTTGRRSGGLVEIVSGVPDGARIVVEGVQRARPGQPVRIVGVDHAAPTRPAPAQVADADAPPAHAAARSPARPQTAIVAATLAPAAAPALISVAPPQVSAPTPPPELTPKPPPPAGAAAGSSGQAPAGASD